nr:recombinase family protein [Candidatus Symbiobacter mobilis]
MREGDALVVTKLDRLARSVADLMPTIQKLDDKPVGVSGFFKIVVAQRNWSVKPLSPWSTALFSMLCISLFDPDGLEQVRRMLRVVSILHRVADDLPAVVIEK